MKKQWIVGALVAVTGLQTSVPAVAQSNRQTTGAVLGGVAGAVVGSQLGNGDPAAAVIGIIAGSLIGSQVGRSMDEADRRAYLEAQRYCFQQSGPSSRAWRGSSRTNASGNFRTGRVGRHYRTQQVCREYYSTININGRVETTSGIACENSRGTYDEVTSREVYFDGTTTTTTTTSSYEPNSFARPGYSQDYSDSRRTSERERARRERERERDRRERERDRDSRYDDNDDDLDVRYPVPPGGSQYPTPPGPQYPSPQYPGSQYPGSPYPGQGGYGIPSMQGAMQFNVTRLAGGAYYRLTLHRPMALSSIQIQIQGAGMRIYDAAVITEASQRLQVPELLVGRVMNSREGAAGFINRTERVVAFDIRAEAFHGQSSLVVILKSREGVPDFRMNMMGQPRY